MNQEKQTSDSVEADENAATVASQADQTTEITGEEQVDAAISTFVEQLDQIAWPSSVRPTAALLAQALTNLRGADSQAVTDLSDGVGISIDNDTITTDQSDVTTEEINIAYGPRHPTAVVRIIELDERLHSAKCGPR